MRAQAPWHCVPKHEGSGFELISKPLQLKGSRVVKVTSFSLFSLGTPLHLFSAGDEAAIAALRSALGLITAEDARGLFRRHIRFISSGAAAAATGSFCLVVSDQNEIR